MGYLTGLNMFFVPYDFRHDSYHSDAANTLARTIRLAYKLNNDNSPHRDALSIVSLPPHWY